MPAHGLYGRLRGVRFNKAEGYFEMLCPGCEKRGNVQYFWPLTLDELGKPEFWDAGSLQRCRACNLEKKRKDGRDKRASDPEYRERLRLEAKAYYAENKKVMSMKHSDYMRGYRERKRAEKAENAKEEAA